LDFRPRQPRRRPSLSGEAYACLSAANEITHAFFGDEPGMKLSVQVDWSASDVTEAKLWIGEKATVLPRGQWTAGLRWNGERARLEWQQAGQPTQEIGRHGFSLFHLMLQLGGLHATGSAGRGVYRAEAAPLTVEVRSDGRLDPFRPDFFTRLRCPADIRAGGAEEDSNTATEARR
jgi:hypothetical protein